MRVALIIAALICFVLAAVGVGFGTIYLNPIGVGLAFYMGALLV